MMAARTAPEKGPTQKTHWFVQLCETADVPKERAGFTLQQNTIFKPGWDVAVAEQEVLLGQASRHFAREECTIDAPIAICICSSHMG